MFLYKPHVFPCWSIVLSERLTGCVEVVMLPAISAASCGRCRRCQRGLQDVLSLLCGSRHARTTQPAAATAANVDAATRGVDSAVRQLPRADFAACCRRCGCFRAQGKRWPPGGLSSGPAANTSSARFLGHGRGSRHGSQVHPIPLNKL